MAKLKRDGSQPLREITFQCKACAATFKAAPYRIDAAPEIEHHPFAYFGKCETCFTVCEQAPWERSLLKAWVNATGPRSADGIAATTKNLAGHPTPDEALRTRFNAMKHGLNARIATFFPAKPDGYAFCRTCEVNRVWCSEQPACVKQQQTFLLHHAAFEQRNPRHLMGIYADLQASIYAVLQQILQSIIVDGVKISTPQYFTDQNGKLIVAEYQDENGVRRIIQDMEAHPLFKPLAELLSRTGLSLADMGMTQKTVEDDDRGEQGQLAHGNIDRETLSDYQQRSLAALEAMAHKVARAQQATQQDPKLIEYQQEQGD